MNDAELVTVSEPLTIVSEPQPGGRLRIGLRDAEGRFVAVHDVHPVIADSIDRDLDQLRTELVNARALLAKSLAETPDRRAARVVDFGFDGCEARRASSESSAGAIGCAALILGAIFYFFPMLAIVISLFLLLAGAARAVGWVARMFAESRDRDANFLRVVFQSALGLKEGMLASGLGYLKGGRFAPKLVFFSAVDERLVLAAALPGPGHAAGLVAREALRQRRESSERKAVTQIATVEAATAAQLLAEREARRQSES
jgi:hypothetical protein